VSGEPPIAEVGAGDAGAAAIWHSALPGAPIAFIEQDWRIGIKLMIRGSGKSTTIHGGPVEELYSVFIRHEFRFLTRCFSSCVTDEPTAGVRLVESSFSWQHNKGT